MWIASPDGTRAASPGASRNVASSAARRSIAALAAVA